MDVVFEFCSFVFELVSLSLCFFLLDCCLYRLFITVAANVLLWLLCMVLLLLDVFPQKKKEIWCDKTSICECACVHNGLPIDRIHVRMKEMRCDILAIAIPHFCCQWIKQHRLFHKYKFFSVQIDRLLRHRAAFIRNNQSILLRMKLKKNIF